MNEKEFFSQYGENKAFNHYVAPSRINLIGEHIDYNGGACLPVAISLDFHGFASIRDDNKIYLYSTAMDDLAIYSLDEEFEFSNYWGLYPFGIYSLLKEKGYKIDKGFNIYYDSKIPPGCGLSSSAALLVLTCYILSDLYSLNISKKDIVLLTQEAENVYNRVKCGILDQSAIALCKENKALHLKCDTFEFDYADIDFKDYELLLLNTNKTRRLGESKYNERVEECQKALSILKHHYNIYNLSELCVCDLDNVKNLLNDDLLFRRVRHIVKENERVSSFIEAAKLGDVSKLGNILNESHYSLRDDYEVTGLHLDAITEAARGQQCCLGARMTGAGFGGFGIALVKKGQLAKFKENVLKEYKEKTGLQGDVLEVMITDGVRKIS